ncbi:MAG: hypothetical protein L0Y71_18065, partial [Gemmataceae bacterium]|nr:hypothetical protein [Gemmataceae bacterium]
MKIGRLLLAGALATTQSGCFFAYALHNLYQAPADCLDEHVLHCRLDKEAKKAWAAVHAQEPGFSADYAAGFRAGFVDYLEYNSLGEPPAAPPYRYRRLCNLSPRKVQAIDDWNAGFRHGASAAHDSGLRS